MIIFMRKRIQRDVCPESRHRMWAFTVYTVNAWITKHLALQDTMCYLADSLLFTSLSVYVFQRIEHTSCYESTVSQYPQLFATANGKYE